MLLLVKLFFAVHIKSRKRPEEAERIADRVALKRLRCSFLFRFYRLPVRLHQHRRAGRVLPKQKQQQAKEEKPSTANRLHVGSLAKSKPLPAVFFTRFYGVRSEPMQDKAGHVIRQRLTPDHKLTRSECQCEWHICKHTHTAVVLTCFPSSSPSLYWHFQSIEANHFSSNAQISEMTCRRSATRKKVFTPYLAKSLAAFHKSSLWQSVIV